MKGSFKKEFPSFAVGIRELLNTVGSAAQAVHHQCRLEDLSEDEVVSNLAMNAINDRPTGNGVSWNVKLEASGHGCCYQTSSGLVFGWEVCSQDYQHHREFNPNSPQKNSWTFFVVHPYKQDIRQDSTLRASLLEKGWTEE
jgi:hypothetical protein